MDFQSLISTLINDPNMQLLAIGVGLFLALMVVVNILRAWFTRRANYHQTFDTVVLLVLVPQMAEEQKAGGAGGNSVGLQQLQEKIAVMETFLSTIAGLKPESGFMAWLRGRQDVFSFEMVMNGGKLSFYISCLKKYQGLLSEQIVAQFPSAVVTPEIDYNIFSPKCVVKGKMMKGKREFFFPIKTYKKMDGDPLNALINALGQTNEKDGAAVQIVARPAGGSWYKMGPKVASKMQQGKKLEDALKEAGKGSLSLWSKDFAKAVSAPTTPDQPLKQYQLTPMEQEVVKGLDEKSSKTGLEVSIRVIAASEEPMKVDVYLQNITNAFAQYNLMQNGNSFVVTDPKMKHFVDDFIYRNFSETGRMILNTEELASIFHFPLASITTHPAIHWLEARQAPAPLDLPKTGVIIGENNYRGVKRVIRFADDDRRRHMYVMGKSGSGKSHFLTNIIVQDIIDGKGVCVMDPHGDLARDILKFVPKERAEDVIYFNPADVDRPMGMNMIEFERPEQKTFVINELMNIFDKLYDLRSTGGPMFEQYFRNAVQLIMEDVESGATLMEVPRVLADEDYRAYKLSKCQNPTVRDFWTKEAQKAGGEASLANMVPYITSKLTQFISNDFMRPIIAQQKSAFSFREAMDQKKIILCDLSKGKIGDMNSDLLGMVIVGKILGAALSRVDMPEEERNDFYLYIDEFQNYLTEGISIILSEARKYHLCLNIAHQFIGQLVKNNDTRIRDAIFGNVGTVVAFRVGVDDAELFAKQFAPVFTEYDVINIPRFEVYVKLLVNAQNPPAFSMKSLAKPKPKNPQLADAIRELSRLKYGRDRGIVEAEIQERSQIAY